MSDTRDVVVVHVLTRLELGGAQLATLKQCLDVLPGRLPAYLICGSLPADAPPGSDLTPLARYLLGARLLLAPRLCRAMRPQHDLRAFFEVRRLLQQIHTQHPQARLLVHTHSSKAGILGRWAAASMGASYVVHSIHGFGHQRAARGRLSFAALQAAERLTARVTDGFVLDSAANLARGRREGIVTDHLTAVVPCNVSLQRFYARGRRAAAAAALRRSLQIPATAPLVVQVSCLKDQKDPLTWVAVAQQVVQRLPAARFLLVGDGELRGRVEREIVARGLQSRLRLLGWRRDVPALLAACDVVLLTSLWEGLPQVVGQAMAAGRPLVATDVDGVAEAITCGTHGFLCAPRDARGLAQAVTRLLQDAALRRRMGAANRARAHHFDAPRMVRSTRAFYRRLLAESSAAH